VLFRPAVLISLRLLMATSAAAFAAAAVAPVAVV
jgi:hypothetical protein